MKSIGDSILTDTLLPSNSDAVDYFTTKDGQTFAGLHLIVELWDCEAITDAVSVDQTLRLAAEKASATILHSHMHSFSPSGGVSGVVLLAESHISIHTWPERSYAAVDIFMCGKCDPYLAIPSIQSGLKADKIAVEEIRRGIVQKT
jgi:S-adenosylmethionine decarboxylase